MLRRKRGLFSSPSEKIISKNTNPTFQEIGGVTRPLITICPAHRVYLLDLFAPVFSFICYWVFIFALSPYYILIYMFLEMIHW